MALTSFGKYVKSEREKKEMSIRELARVLDVEPTTVSRLENGTHALPHPDLFVQLIFALDLDWRTALNHIGPYRRMWNMLIGYAAADYKSEISKLQVEEEV